MRIGRKRIRMKKSVKENLKICIVVMVGTYVYIEALLWLLEKRFGLR